MGGTYPENILRTLSSGTYYIRVHSHSGYSTVNKYSLNVYVGSDDYEYNDTIENATILGTLSNTASASYTYDSSVSDEVSFESEEIEFDEFVGEKTLVNTIDSLSTQASSFIVNAKISTSIDRDIYKIQAIAGQTFDVELSNIPSSYHYMFQIKNSNGQVMYTSVSGAGITKTCSYTPPSTGVYYLEVYTNSGYSNSDSYKYMLVIASRDQYEPNNTLSVSGAKDLGTITSSKQLEASIHIRSDQDCYRFYIPNTVNVNITLSNIPTGCNFDIELLNSSGGSIQSTQGSNNSTENITRTLTAGYYYVRVYSDNTCSGQFYSLSITTNSISGIKNDHVYKIRSLGRNLYMYVPYGRDFNTQMGITGDFDTENAEAFRVKYNAEYDAYWIAPICSYNGEFRVLDIARGGYPNPVRAGNMVNVYVPSDLELDAQLFKVVLVGENKYKIEVAQYPGLVVAATSSLTNRLQIEVYDPNNLSHHWDFTEYVQNGVNYNQAEEYYNNLGWLYMYRDETKQNINYITSSYGRRLFPTEGVVMMHSGIDIGTGASLELMSPTKGTYITDDFHTSLGYWCAVESDNYVYGSTTQKLRYAFLHMEARPSDDKSPLYTGMYEGAPVYTDTLIGYTGNSGKSTGIHLHFTVIQNGGGYNTLLNADFTNTLNPLMFYRERLIKFRYDLTLGKGIGVN